MSSHRVFSATLLTLALLAAPVAPARAGGRPSLTGARLTSAKRDFRKVRAGDLDLGAWKQRYGVSNGAMTRLRRTYPNAFPHLDRTRSFSQAELTRMQGDWAQASRGEITLTRFKEIWGLSTQTYGRLMEQHGELFKPFKPKLGGLRLALQRRAARFDPARINKLADAWDREVLTGKRTLAQFYSSHGTSKKEITALRKRPELEGRFASATGLHASQRRNMPSATQVRRLSDLWMAGVHTGDKTIAQFKKEQGLSQGVYRELRADKQAFPDPLGTPNTGAPPRRTFSAGELEAMTHDWKQVSERKLPRTAFLRKYHIDAKMFKRLRDAHPERFFYLGATTRKTQFAGAKLETMKADWLEVIAGRQREVDFRGKHGLSTTLFSSFRNEPANRADFPKIKGNSRPAAVVAAEPDVVDDWARVRAGELKASTFRTRHPRVHAADVLSLQRAARRPGKRTLAERLGFDRYTLRPHELAQLQKNWSRVTRREITQEALLRELKVPVERLYAYRHDNVGAFPGAPPKPKPAPKPRDPGKYARADLYDATTLDKARALYAPYLRGEQTLAQIQPALQKIGVSTSGAGIAYLRKIDPVAFASRNAFLDANHDAIVDDLVHVASGHRHVIRKWSDLAEVVAKDASFNARYGQVNLSPMAKTLRRDRDGDRRLHDLMANFTQIGKGQGPPRGVKRAEVRVGAAARETAARVAASATEPPSRRDSARALSRALRGLKPTPENMNKVVARLKASGDPNFSTRRKWMLVRSEFDGVLPELAKWNFDAHRPYSLRYVARWAQAMHEAGPGADYERIATIFKRTAEYKQDGRLPPKAAGTVQLAQSYPELISSWAVRRTYQRTRQLLELLRTAPAGSSLYALRDKVAAVGYKSHNQAQLALSRLSAAKVSAMGLDAQLFATLAKGGFKGLGKRPNPRFDANREPPGIDLQLAREILETPTMPPLLKYGIKRLKGERPFESHNVMFVYHRYSDIVSLVDAMAAAGMSRSDATFVSTPYPFKDSVSYMYRKRGLTVLEPSLSTRSYAKNVEQGIRKMLTKYAAEEKKWGKGKPIMILDDGGMASKIIGIKFKEHIGKFRILEVTAAGERLAGKFKKKYGRLAFPYFSIAFTKLKRRVTSAFYGGRVSDRLLNLVPQTGKPLKNKRATVIGAGPMGLSSGLRLIKQGFEVTFVDPGPRAQKLIRRLARKRPDLGLKMDSLERALPGRSVILGMTGYQVLTTRHLELIDDGAFVAQGSSKRNEFDMVGIAKAATSKKLLPRQDGLAQKSYSYSFGRGAKAKQLHFLGDGWTLNHDGSLHGTPMRDVQLELGILFESAVQLAHTPLGKTGVFHTIDAKTQHEYYRVWKRLLRRER